MSIEAMKQALEALECIFASTHPYRGDESTFTDEASVLGDKAITSLRQHIEQAEKQEPVAYTVTGEVKNWAMDFSKYKTQHYTRPVYTTPQPQPQPCPYIRSTREGTHHCALSQRPWVDLTDEQVSEIGQQASRFDWLVDYNEAIDFVVENTNTLLREKNQ